jgi:hypothetical protein
MAPTLRLLPSPLWGGAGGGGRPSEAGSPEMPRLILLLPSPLVGRGPGVGCPVTTRHQYWYGVRRRLKPHAQ